MLFQPRHPHFSAFRALYSAVVCWWLWKEPVSLLMMRWGCRRPHLALQHHWLLPI